MSGGRVKVNATNYNIVGGKVKVGGTNYIVPRGKTKVGSTNYTIQLYPKDLKHLLASAEWYGGDGTSLGGPGEVGISWGYNGTLYAFSTIQGQLGIYKVTGTTSGPTSETTIYQSSTQANIYITGRYIYCSSNAKSSARNARAQTLALFKFHGYSEAEIDSILSKISLTRLANRNSSTTAALTTATSNLTGKIVMVQSEPNIAFTYVTAYNNYKVLASSGVDGIDNTSYLYFTSSTTGYSTTGTSNTAVYGGGIVTIA